MTRLEKLLQQLETNFDGSPWHGSPVRRILDDISQEKAQERPIAEARSIAELLGHLTAWNEIVERRLSGEAVDVTAEMDFPDVSNVAWDDQIESLERAHQKLRARIQAMKDEQLDAIVPGKKYSAEAMIEGVMHHNTYHSAQIALLKK